MPWLLQQQRRIVVWHSCWEFVGGLGVGLGFVIVWRICWHNFSLSSFFVVLFWIIFCYPILTFCCTPQPHHIYDVHVNIEYWGCDKCDEYSGQRRTKLFVAQTFEIKPLETKIPISASVKCFWKSKRKFTKPQVKYKYCSGKTWCKRRKKLSYITGQGRSYRVLGM
jgi:hypothetical protein